MNDLMIAKIEELIQRKIQGETAKESCSRLGILQALKTCLLMAQHNYMSYAPTEHELDCYRIAARQTIHTFLVLHRGLVLSNTSRSFNSAFTNLIAELFAIIPEVGQA